MAGRSTFLHVLWRCLFVVAVLFVCMPQSSGENAELETTLRCALLGKFERKCKIEEGPQLNAHLVDLMKKSPGSFRSLIRGHNSDLKANLAAAVPPALLYVVPYNIWSRVEPKVVVELVKAHKTNEAIATLVVRGYSNASLANRKDFVRSFDFNSPDHSMNALMVSGMSSHWGIDEDTILEVNSPALFVALPETRVLKMDKNQHNEMLDAIVRWDSYGLNKGKWFNLPVLTKRVWAMISRNYSYRGQEKRTTTPLLAGASPTELSQDGGSFSDYELVKLPLKNRLQIRALLPFARSAEVLSRIDLGLLKDWFLFLSPDQIRRFKDDVDFTYTVKEKQHEYWSYPNHQKAFAQPSVPTLRQIIEITTMRNNQNGDLPLDPTKWGNEVSVFGPLAFLIGARRLGKLEPDQKGLDLHALKDIDSYCFSKRMARHLMFNCKNILKVRGLLRGVPTGKLLSSGESGIDGMDNLREIVQNIPADLPARTALVFRKMRENLGVFDNLKAILRNPYPEQFVSLLTLQETRTLYKGLFSHWTSVQSENLVDKIHLLPDSVLSNLLGSPKKLGKESNLSSHLESRALGGLTCERLLAVDTSLFPETVAAMRHARKRAGKTDMAKKIQRCARVALDRFLVERAAASYESQKVAIASLATAINPVDVANFGGFVMATFTPAEIAGNPFAKDILKSIGSLSAYELLSAVPCYKCLRKMAETAAEIIDARRNLTLSHLSDLGSLVGFLPATLISKIHPADWRVIVEAAALDGSAEPLCTDEESRDAWEKLIRAAFGAPEHWTADTLASIGGYMPAIQESSLHGVSLDQRALAGDTIGLTSGAPYLRGVDIVGYDHPRPYWKVCRDLLASDERKDFENSLFNAARFQLFSAQLFASKVKSADVLKELKTKSTYKAAQELPPAPTTEASAASPQLFLPWNPFRIETPESTTQDIPISTEATEASAASPQLVLPWNPFRIVTSESTTLIPEESSPNKENIATTLAGSGDFFATVKPSEDKKLEVSADLDDFMAKAFEEMGLKPSTIETEPPTESTPAVTVPVTEEAETEEGPTYDTLPVTDASLDFLQGQELSNKPIEANSSSQVYVDPEGRLGESIEDVPELKQSFKDLPARAAEPSSTAKPAVKTNGTVYGLPDISVPVESSSEPSSEAASFEGDTTLVISASANRSDVTSYKSSSPPTTEIPRVSSSPGATPNPLISTTPMIGAARRRRDVAVQGFEVPLTCDGLLTMGPAAALALSLSDVDMAYDELEDCVEFIGKLELPKELAEAFWKKLKMAAHWDTVGDLGCLVAGMSPDDVANLKLDTSDDHFLDTISVISSYADKQVLESVISTLKSRLDEEIKSKKTVALAEEIILALGPNVCLLPPDTRSFLVNTPKVLVRSLSGINRQEWFHRSACDPECIRGLLSVLVNQNKSQEWVAEDFRNAGVLVAGFSEQELTRMSGINSQIFAEMSAGATRCLSPSQFKAMQSEPLMWLSAVAAGALSDDQLGVVPEEQRGILKSAVFGRPGIDTTGIQKVTGTSGASDFTSSLALTVILSTLVVKCYLL